MAKKWCALLAAPTAAHKLSTSSQQTPACRLLQHGVFDEDTARQTQKELVSSKQLK